MPNDEEPHWERPPTAISKSYLSWSIVFGETSDGVSWVARMTDGTGRTWETRVLPVSESPSPVELTSVLSQVAGMVAAETLVDQLLAQHPAALRAA